VSISSSGCFTGANVPTTGKVERERERVRERREFIASLSLIIDDLLDNLGLVLEQQILNGFGIQIAVYKTMLQQHFR